MKIEDRLSDAMHDYADAIEPSEGSWTRIAARFDDGAPPRRPERGRLVLAGVAITLVVVLIAVLAIRDDGATNKVVTGPGASATPMPSRILAIADGGAPVVLDSTTGERLDGFGSTAGIAAGTQVAVTPDGKSVYVVKGDGNAGCGDHTIELMPTDPDRASILPTRPHATSPTVSPDGRYLAYLSCRQGQNRAEDIVLEDLTNSQTRTTPAPPGTFFVNRLEFTADSRHILFDLFEDTLGRDVLREIDIVAGEPAPGRDVGVAVGRQGWVGVRGTTGEYLGVKGAPPSVLFMQGPSPFTAGPLFTLPANPTQVESDRSGDHILTLVNGDLYRWSVGDEKPTKLVGDYTAAAWIPDARNDADPSPDASLPSGVVGSTIDGTVVSIGSDTGQVHKTLAQIPPRSSVNAVPPDGLTAVYGTVFKNGPCGEPRSEVGTVDLDSGDLTRIVSGATSPIVSPDGRFVAYGIQCDGVTLGFSDLRNGNNYRTEPFPRNANVGELSGIDPIAWAPDSKNILYRVVFQGFEDPTYWVGRLWPPQDDTGPKRLPKSARFSAATFVDDTTLAVAADDHGRSRVRFVDLQFQPVAGEGFEVPGRIERLAVDPSGRHFLAVTLDGELYRWSLGDPAPTNLADDVVSAGWTWRS